MTEPSERAPSLLDRLLSGQRAGVAALVVAVAALVVALAPYATGTDFGSRVRTYLVQNPEVLREVSIALDQKAQQQQIADNRQKAAEVTARVAANPALLAVDAGDPAFGPANARVTVIEYFDFRCPGCKATAPEVLRLARAFAQEHLVPRVREAFRQEKADPAVIGEMGKVGLLGSTIPPAR